MARTTKTARWSWFSCFLSRFLPRFLPRFTSSLAHWLPRRSWKRPPAFPGLLLSSETGRNLVLLDPSRSMLQFAIKWEAPVDSTVALWTLVAWTKKSRCTSAAAAFANICGAAGFWKSLWICGDMLLLIITWQVKPIRELQANVEEFGTQTLYALAA